MGNVLWNVNQTRVYTFEILADMQTNMTEIIVVSLIFFRQIG